VDLLLNVFILLAQVSVTLTESEDEARCLDQMGVETIKLLESEGVRENDFYWWFQLT
jgi:hypothetical protein